MQNKPPKQGKKGSTSQTVQSLRAANKKSKTAAIVGFVALGCVVGLLVADYAGVIDLNIFNTGEGGGTTPTSAFSLSVYDPMIGKNLDLSDFDATVWRLPANGDWTDRVQMETGTLASISEGDLDLPSDGSACIFVVEYNGTVQHEDAIYGDDEDWGARGYYRRMDEIKRGQANQLKAYQTPGSANIIVTNLETCAFINVTANNVTTSANISIMVMTNASQPDAVYKSFYDYAAEDWVKPYILYTANATINSTSLSTSGNVESSNPSTTTELAEFETLGATPQIYIMKWDPDTPATVQINTIQLGFSSVLAAAGS